MDAKVALGEDTSMLTKENFENRLRNKEKQFATEQKLRVRFSVQTVGDRVQLLPVVLETL